MKTLCRVLAALLALSAAGPAMAAPMEWYVLGGPVRANLGGDAGRFGQDQASGVEQFLPTGWTSHRLTQPGLDVALGLHTRSDRPLGLAVELHYVQHGTHFRLSDSDTLTPDIDLRMKLKSVELPILLQWTSRRGSWIEPSVVVGPVVGVSFRSALDIKTAGLDESINLEQVMQDVHVGGLIGAGARLRTGPHSAFLVHARFGFDVDDRFRDFGYSMKSRDLSFLVGFTLGGGARAVPAP